MTSAVPVGPFAAGVAYGRMGGRFRQVPAEQALMAATLV
jgi:hypothetical protein